MNNKEADAAAVFAMSSPDGSDFGSSPAGRALRQARADCDRAFFAPFEDSPSPNKQAQNTSSLGVAGSPRVCISTFEEDVTAEEIILQKIAAAVEEEAEGSCGSDGDLDSGGSDSDDYASSNQVSDDASPDRPAPRALTTKAACGWYQNAWCGERQRRAYKTVVLRILRISVCSFNHPSLSSHSCV